MRYFVIRGFGVKRDSAGQLSILTESMANLLRPRGVGAGPWAAQRRNSLRLEQCPSNVDSSTDRGSLADAAIGVAGQRLGPRVR